MKENKNIIIGVIIVIIVIILGCFVGCKLFNVVKYKTDFTNEEYQDIVSRLQIKDVITIKSTILNDDKYIGYDGLKIRNDFKDYEIVYNDDNHITYENKEKNILISISGLTESIVDKIKNDGFLKLKEKDLVYILEKNNIENDYDLIKYISNQKNKNNNIFTSANEMKENYFMYFATYIHMSVGENITLIEGDYKGYILNMYDIKSIHIIKDNKTYTFTLSNVSDNYIKELLNTLIIEEQKTSSESTTKYVTEEIELKYETITIKDVSKKIGTKEIRQKGINGIEEVTYKITYDKNGNEISKEAIEVKVIKEVVNEEVVVGASN